MAGIYVDTSALGRLLLGEPDAPTIRSTLANYAELWSSELVIVELRRLAARENLIAAGERLLSGIKLAPLNRGSLESSSRLAPLVVRSPDAIHLEAAVVLEREAPSTRCSHSTGARLVRHHHRYSPSPPWR